MTHSNKFFTNLVIICLPMLSMAQTYQGVVISEKYVVHEVRNEDKVLNEKDSSNFYYIYSYNKKKDTVLVYAKKTDEINFEKTKYTLSTKTPNSLFLNIVNDNESRKLTITFFDIDKSIRMDKTMFFLNRAYYAYLKNKLLNQKNISELIDLIDDFLQEDIFKIDELKFFSSKEKYKNRSFKILKAKMTTTNPQNEDILTNWVIDYLYSKNGVLTSVKQKSKDILRYNKTLIKNVNNVFSYKINWEVDERFSDDKNETFDLLHNKYTEKGTHFQVGLNKETDYEKIINIDVNFLSKKLELRKKEIIQVTQKLVDKLN